MVYNKYLRLGRGRVGISTAAIVGFKKGQQIVVFAFPSCTRRCTHFILGKIVIGLRCLVGIVVVGNANVVADITCFGHLGNKTGHKAAVGPVGNQFVVILRLGSYSKIYPNKLSCFFNDIFRLPFNNCKNPFN